MTTEATLPRMLARNMPAAAGVTIAQNSAWVTAKRRHVEVRSDER